MNDIDARHGRRGASDAPKPALSPADRPAGRRPRHGLVLALGTLLVLVPALAYGTWRFDVRQRAARTTAEQHRTFVPDVRVATIGPSAATVDVSLPATTLAFAQANIFARASGYIEKRYVDIGDHVKAGQLLADITAPELDHQIAQAQATLGQLDAAVKQAQANRELAGITWHRDSTLVHQGWVSPQQGSIDTQNLKALDAAVGVAQANVAAQQAQLQVLNQQKAYQRVVAPFDGVITQRNIDVGTLVQADATSGTFMFTLMQSDVIRAQVYVPQDHAVGVRPGVAAEVRVPELPDHPFPGTVTRIADALQPDTRTLLTEVDIPNPDGLLKPGTYCTIVLHVPRRVPGLMVPADAVVFNQDGLNVAVVDGGVVRLRKITVARDFGTEVEVRDGVKAGDQVVLNPPVDLADGSRVRTLSDATGTTGAGPTARKEG